MARHAIWSVEARDTALKLLETFARFVKTEVGDVKQLHGFHPPLYRLRIGDWRLTFRKSGSESIDVVRIRNRKEAYR